MNELLVWLGAHPLFPALAALFAMAIGAFVTWIVARWYYRKAANDLRDEVASLHRATSLVASWLENPDIDKKMRRDDEGRVVGMDASIRASSARLGIAGHSAALTDGNSPAGPP